MALTERAFMSSPVSFKLILQGTAIKKSSLKYWMCCSHDPTKVAEVILKVFTRDIVPNTLQK